jgi:hypothetical protein
VFVVKKYPCFYLEDTASYDQQAVKRKKMIRSRKSMERLRTLRMLNIEEQFQKEFEKKFPNQSSDAPKFFNQKEMQDEIDAIRMKLEEQKHALLECF